MGEDGAEMQPHEPVRGDGGGGEAEPVPAGADEAHKRESCDQVCGTVTWSQTPSL